MKGLRIGKAELPKIVEDGLFDQAQQARSRRITLGGGRKAKENLYTKLARCEVCEQPMTFRDGHLFCKNEECPSDKRWRYADFDASFAEIVAEVDRVKLRREQVSDDLQLIKQEIVFWQMKKFARQKKIATLNQMILELSHDINQIEAEIAKLKAASRNSKSIKTEAGPLKGHGQTCGDNEQARLKNRIAAHTKELVRDVLIAADGTAPRLDKRIEQAERIKFDPQSVGEAFIRDINDLKDAPFFIVRFKNGEELLGVPNKQNPRCVDWWRKEGLGEFHPRREEKHGLPAARPVSTFSAPEEFSFRVDSDNGKGRTPFSVGS